MGKDMGQDSFRVLVGRAILIGAVSYCFLLTIALACSAIFKVELSQPIRDLLIIILTWFTTKAGSVIDHSYGGSFGSDSKTNFMMSELKKKDKEEEVCEVPPEVPKVTVASAPVTRPPAP